MTRRHIAAHKAARIRFGVACEAENDADPLPSESKPCWRTPSIHLSKSSSNLRFGYGLKRLGPICADCPLLRSLPEGSDQRRDVNGGAIHLPGRNKDRPDPDRLAMRFERFRQSCDRTARQGWSGRPRRTTPRRERVASANVFCTAIYRPRSRPGVQCKRCFGIARVTSVSGQRPSLHFP